MTATAESSGIALEQNGINVIGERERRGTPRSLFWPWCAANISVFAISYGAFLLGFGLSFWQAACAAVVGSGFSFGLCGLAALAGKRGSAPTMVLSRAAFGVRGNTLPTALAWVTLVGWEIVLVALSTLATSTVLTALGAGAGSLTEVLAFLLTAALVVAAGILGYQVIMKLQVVITVATGALTVGYVVLTVRHISLPAVGSLPSGSVAGLVGALILAATALGLGWVNTAADYSRYLPRTSSSVGVVGWTTLGGAVAPVVLIIFGILLVGSTPGLGGKIGADPIGALTTLLPTWYLVPFVLVAVLGLVGGAVLDIYSSGLALLTLGLRTPRWVAAALDGVLMVLGTAYVVFVADDFLGPFQGFLITAGVPMAAWAGVFIADLALRRSPYADADLFDPGGRYGSVHWPAVLLVVAGTVTGWGLVTNGFAGWLGWQGFLLGPLGLGGRHGAWAFANLGVMAALLLGFVGWLLVGRATVRRQERVARPPLPSRR